MDPEKKSLNFIFPTKYAIPKSLKFSHWPSKIPNSGIILRFNAVTCQLSQTFRVVHKPRSLQMVIDLHQFCAPKKSKCGYTTENQHISPMEKETHLPKYLFSWDVLVSI